MKILVTIKLVVDPDIPQNKFKINHQTKYQEIEDNPIVISSYDENALEIALKLKDKYNFNVDIITLTSLEYSQPIKKALAMGADKAFILRSNQHYIETKTKAQIIYNRIKDKEYDLIITGFESADWGSRTFAPMLASFLNYPIITSAYKIEKNDNHLIVHKLTENGTLILKTPPKIVISITTHQENQPRYPKVKDIMLASKKPIIIEEINLENNQNSNEIIKLEQPQSQINCEIIQGKDVTEKAQKLFLKLKELKILN